MATPFELLPLRASCESDDEDANAPAARRLAQLFTSRFASAPAVVARAPGRVNLIGEHVDYEGYAVLPMALQLSVTVAARATQHNAPGISLTVANVNTSKYDAAVDVPLAAIIAADPQQTTAMELVPPHIATPRTAWARYAVCGAVGILGSQDTSRWSHTHIDLLVDGDIPAGCGLSSSSALVVATALAVAAALDPLTIPTREALAALCRRAEHFVGTMGGGMDQAVACLACHNSALHIAFDTSEASATPVTLPTEALGLKFVVANSLVEAHKAVDDGATQFNKRVVECALAAKAIAKHCGIDNWQHIERLVDVQLALERVRHKRVALDELEGLAAIACPQAAYTRADLEKLLATPLNALFTDAPAAQRVIAQAATYELQQRAQHVFAEAARVAAFRQLCELNATTSTTTTDSDIPQRLGALMLASHRSCQTLYSCSCAALDALVACAVAAGAFGARLTGAGWGGCVVALVDATRVASFIATLDQTFYSSRGATLAPVESAVAFEVLPSSGASVFVYE